MRIGVAKEIKPQEYRVALTPAGARELVQRGHDVLVEAGAGSVALSRTTHTSVRARRSSRWTTSGGALSSCSRSRSRSPRVPAAPRGSDALHVPPYRRRRAAHPRARRLRDHRDRVRDGGDRPRRAAAARADERDRGAARCPGRRAIYLEKPKGGRGILLGGVAGVAPARVLVIGGGMVGYNAAVIALGMGAQVTILERSVDRMRYPRADPERARAAPHVVGAPARGVDQGRRPRDRRRAHPGRARAEARHAGDARTMKESSVFVDVAIDQGGCAETSQADDARRSRLHGRRRHPLLRREHARRRADHLDAGADERDAARTSSSSRISARSARSTAIPSSPAA